MINIPKVSVIIPNYNGVQFLEKCLKALEEQNINDFEVIIVDNFSSDTSIEFVENNTEYRCIKLDKNYGFSRAVNEGIKNSKGQYVLLLNNDAIVENDFIEQMVKSIEKDQSIFSVSSKMIDFHNRSQIDDAGDEFTLFGWAHQRGRGISKSYYSKEEEVFSACGGAALYRKDVFEQIGYLDNDFFAYMEDLDLGYRARIYGYKNMYCPEAIVYHIGSATSKKQSSTFTLRLVNRNTILMIYKNMPILQIVINIPVFTLGFLVKSLYHIRDKERKVAYIDALKEGFKMCKKVRKVRFQKKHLMNYCRIQAWLIEGTYNWIREKLIAKSIDRSN